MGRTISIHALLAESDYSSNSATTSSPNFYPRSPCGERLCAFWMARSHPLFLSTLSLRRATAFLPADRMSHQEFLSTLSLRRATTFSAELAKRGEISIHALLAESDSSSWSATATSQHFYPRSPCGERPLIFSCYYNTRIISIHALLAESDHFPCTELYQQRYFYPRSPCGERPDIIGHTCNISAFLSTLSLRRATW